MADIMITIKVSDDERYACLAAIKQLNDIPHVKHMSIAAIAETANIKATKCRAVLNDLVDHDYVDKFVTTDNPRLQRFYYVIKTKGREFMEKSNNGYDT